MNSNNTFLSIENEKHCIRYKIMSNNLVRSCNCERLAINGKPNMTGLLLGQQILIVQTILPSTFPTISRRKQKIFSYRNNNNGRSPVNNRTKTLYYRTKCSTTYPSCFETGGIIQWYFTVLHKVANLKSKLIIYLFKVFLKLRFPTT